MEYLTRAIKNNRLAHALLFIGEDKLSKENAAFELASTLTTHPMGVQIIESESSSLKRKNPAKDNEENVSNEIKIEAIRRLNQEQYMQVAEGEKHVWIIIDAHRLTTQAANALLKTLEEPQAGQIIILLAPSLRSVLPTIASRCQRVIFPQPNNEQSKIDDDIEKLTQRIQKANASARLIIVEELSKQGTKLPDTLMQIQRVLIRQKNIAAVSALENAQKSLKSHGNTQLVLEELLLKTWPIGA